MTKYSINKTAEQVLFIWLIKFRTLLTVTICAYQQCEYNKYYANYYNYLK